MNTPLRAYNVSIQRLTRALELISKEVGGVHVHTVSAFLFVARRGKCTQKDVEIELGLSNAAISRNISFWTSRRYDRGKGLGFIQAVENDYDRRFKELTLTPLGVAFYKRLLEAIER
ncbi:MarR family winged helix-turn-helix transcriptional regulator [Bradyrhizobium sp.]|uniref:MarR family winged helix-turn-helix transcriptional regulator n=1 Tax=Bradyrhizobium sp. TaxID=376 RepID=UPI00238479D1|nr:MarR family winged helix-turn-helix transcriptional regulator [Bradyrhizobium sp.]MDE2379666.1 winged helix-turn-helix transcriptional regulator [Bradyrhizobium sp.]